MWGWGEMGAWGGREVQKREDVCMHNAVSSLPVGTSGKAPVCQFRRHKRYGFNLWVGKIPRRRAWQPTLVYLPENSMDRGAWRATILGVAKNQT